MCARLFPSQITVFGAQAAPEIVRGGPVGMAAGRTLVNAHWQGPHLGDAIENLPTKQHAAATWLRALTDNNLDRIGAAQISWIHAVAGRQIMIDQRLRMTAFFLCQPATECCMIGL